MPSNQIPRKIAQRRHEAALPGPCHLPTLHTLPRFWYHSLTCGNSNSTAEARIGSSADREFYPLHLQLRATSNGVAFFVGWQQPQPVWYNPQRNDDRRTHEEIHLDRRENRRGQGPQPG